MNIRNRIDRLSRFMDTGILKPICPSCKNLGHSPNYFTPARGDRWDVSATMLIPDHRVDRHGRCIACGMLPDPYWAPAPVFNLELPDDIQCRAGQKTGVSQ